MGFKRAGDVTLPGFGRRARSRTLQTPLATRGRASSNQTIRPSPAAATTTPARIRVVAMGCRRHRRRRPRRRRRNRSLRWITGARTAAAPVARARKDQGCARARTARTVATVRPSSAGSLLPDVLPCAARARSGNTAPGRLCGCGRGLKPTVRNVRAKQHPAFKPRSPSAQTHPRHSTERS